MASTSVIFCAVVSTLLGFCTSYPTGAPQETCSLFTANHEGHTASNAAHNFQLTVSPANITPGAIVTVTLKGLGGDKFKGFFIQGQESSTKNPVGKFQRPSNAQTIDCSGPGSANAVTHVNPNEKDRVTFIWTAPTSFHGTVVFRSVVVKTYEQFWNNIYSNQITVA